MVNIRWADPSDEDAQKLPPNMTQFYHDYSELVYTELTREAVQNIIQHIINKERIDVSKITEIRIMRLPFGYSTKGMLDVEEKQRPPGITVGHRVSALVAIDIYPPEFPRDSQVSWLRERREAGYYFTLFEPLRVLICELLHVRYLGDEDAVVRLADGYMRRFERSVFSGVIFSGGRPFWESLRRAEF